MPISIARAALLLTLAAPLACRDASAPESETRIAERNWAQRSAASYRITVSRDCFCPPEMAGPVVVEVVGGEVRSRHYEATGQPVPEASVDLFPGIGGLFAIVDAARREGRQLTVAYHPRYGYPTRIDIDRDHRPWDGGVTWEARDLVLR